VLQPLESNVNHKKMFEASALPQMSLPGTTMDGKGVCELLGLSPSTYLPGYVTVTQVHHNTNASTVQSTHPHLQIQIQKKSRVTAYHCGTTESSVSLAVDVTSKHLLPYFDNAVPNQTHLPLLKCSKGRVRHIVNK
jgi:hypothetical protein